MADDAEVSPPGEAHRGLFTDFEGYRSISEADTAEALRSGLIALDANVLLNLYRYTDEARDDLIAVLHVLRNRLWLPHWVVREFWRNRESVLRNPRDTTQTIEGLHRHRDGALEVLRRWINRAVVDVKTAEKLKAQLDDAFTQVVSRIDEEERRDLISDTGADPVVSALADLLRGKVGSPLAPDDQERAVREGLRRLEAEIPPGYRDKKKPGMDAAGDYILWRQLLDEVAKRKPQTVVLVTGDLKDDWWREEAGERRGPRNELVDEMIKETGARLLMMSPGTLLRNARVAFDIEIRPGSAETANRIDVLASEGDHVIELQELSQLEFEDLVRRMLESMESSTGEPRKFTMTVGPDGSVDVFLQTKHGPTIMRFTRSTQPISVAMIKQLIVTREAMNAARASLVATSGFTWQAREAVKGDGDIRLVDGHYFASWLRTGLGVQAFIAGRALAPGLSPEADE
jgi:hypothetical protein